MKETGDKHLIVKKHSEKLKKDLLESYKIMCDRLCINDMNYEKYDLVTEDIKQICANIGVGICAYNLEVYNEPTYIHSVKVADLCMIIGEHMNFNRNNIIELGIAGLLHDIGKLYIPINIIIKPGRLDEIETVIINTHPSFSAYYLRENYTSINNNIITGVLEHHERLDGTGYPRHLRNNDISIIGKIVAVADIFEAYSSNRSYHKARTIMETIEFMKQSNGLDQKIIDILIGNITQNHNMIAV